MVCSYCRESGHTRVTCKSRKQDDAMWKVQKQLLEVEKQKEKELIEKLAKETIKEILALAAEQAKQPKKKAQFTMTLD